MAKISYTKLKSDAKAHGFTLKERGLNLYWLNHGIDLEPTFSGTFNEVRVWILGYDFYKTEITHNYELLRKA